MTCVAGMRLCGVVVVIGSGAMLSAGPPASGVMAKVPMTLGYYVNSSETCARASSVMKFGPNSVRNIYEDGSDESRLASVARQKDGYFLKFAGKHDEQDPSGILLSPKGKGRIEVTIQDTAMMHHCAPAQLPQRLRK